MAYTLHLILIALVVSIESQISLDSMKNDYRFISYQDLQLAFDRFSQDSVTTYSQLLFDVSRNQVIVGARDTLLRLSLPELQLIESSTWSSNEGKVQICLQKGQTEENCHNFIKVLVTNGKALFVCGTDSFAPQCTWRDIENVTHVTRLVDGIARCPYNPLANSTALLSENGEYFIGGPTDFSGSDFAIYRSISELPVIRTEQYNSLWLNEPQFVASFETDRFIYFLFREAAVEYINCGKIIYSRIARVCKDDNNGKTLRKGTWTTFLKARLNCSINGDYPFYFNEIQSASYIPEEGLIYTTFSTPPNSIAGSAICAFNLSAVESVFSGPFKYQEQVNSTWDKHDSAYRDHFECKPTTHGNHLIESSKYQLMDNAVQPTKLKPLHIAELERYTHITVDVLSTKLHRTVHVLFVATIEGFIKKISVLPRTLETCIVEVWQAVPISNVPIFSFQYLKDTNSIYVGTKTELLKIPSHHCNRHVSQDSCLNAMDPYCGWNEYEDACTTAPQREPLTSYWMQSITSCPVLDARIDGGWSSWSEWSPCIHRNGQNSDSHDNCICQMRHCNNPAPKNEGKLCVGPSIAVSNCTVHGGWTAWSAWSECSATCGVAVKTRTRTCTNPSPVYGGRVCVGQDRSEVLCTKNPPCPVKLPTPQNGIWDDWSNWEECSTSCGGGYRRRFRMCKTPLNGGLDCIGSNVEYEKCNLKPCPEIIEQITVSPWTGWIVSNISLSNEFVLKRYKYACTAPVESTSKIQINIHKEEGRICVNLTCALNNHDNGKWSLWGPCLGKCGKGKQIRQRQCEGQCKGRSTQQRECDTGIICKGEWSPWTEWSNCSVTCGLGIRKRFRACFDGFCEGIDHDEEFCEMESCGSLLGWTNWTSWSICDSNKLQYRRRTCRTVNPGPTMCQGPSQESRMCVDNPYISDELETILRASHAQTNELTSVALILGYSITGFIRKSFLAESKNARITCLELLNKGM
ncbi:Sema-5c [Trypoxylus dichotomus]